MLALFPSEACSTQAKSDSLSRYVAEASVVFFDSRGDRDLQLGRGNVYASGCCLTCAHLPKMGMTHCLRHGKQQQQADAFVRIT